jgi:glycosyl transferase family 25
MENFFSYLNHYFDKVFVVTVHAAVERRRLFDERFRGLEYSYFFGADKNEFTIEEAEKTGLFNEELARKHHRFSKTMKHGEIACSLSHRYIYEEVVRQNYKRVLIFEDDAVPDTTLLKDIPAILNEIPADCELLMWGWDKNDQAPPGAFFKKLVYHVKHGLGRLKWDHKMITNLYARPYSAHLKKAGFHDYTYAYSISNSGAKKLAGMQSPVQYIADNLLAHAATREITRSYIVWPKLFHHDSLPDGTHRDSYIR